VRILLWHVHGSWTTAFVQGPHRYLLPMLPDRRPDGRGRAETWDWPEAAIEVGVEDARDAEIDAVILQRPHELELAERWLGGRRPGRDVPAIYLEHNAPQGRIAEMRHPLADRKDLTLVHVTEFNDLFWDAGSTPTRVIAHGVPDPGYRYTGELARCAVAINEPLRRGRVTGTDLLQRFGRVAPLDLFGMGTRELGGFGDTPQARLHELLPRRRAYLHPLRWTSLGLSLIEAMYLGMPVVALAATAACEAVPPEAGVLSTCVETLCATLGRLMADPEEAREQGRHARRAVRERFSLERFLGDWDALLEQVTGCSPVAAEAQPA
jgi:glycosyltransferase involved in cell wall biosynthesis